MKETPILLRFVRPLIAITIIIGCIAYLFALLFKDIPPSNTDVLMIAIGYVLAKMGDVTAYYFGNSKDKSDAEQSARHDMKTTITTTSNPTTPIKGNTRLSELLIIARDTSLPMADREDAIRMINEIYPELGKTTFETLPNIPS